MVLFSSWEGLLIFCFFLETIPFGYSIKSSKTFNLSYKSDCVGNGILSNGLYYIIYKTMPFMVQCMFTLALKDV